MPQAALLPRAEGPLAARVIRWPRAQTARGPVDADGSALDNARGPQDVVSVVRSIPCAVHSMPRPRGPLAARSIPRAARSHPRAVNSMPRPDLRVGAERRQGYHALELFIYTAQHSCALLHSIPMSQTPMRVVIELNPRPIKITRQIVYPFKFLIFVYSVERNRSNCATPFKGYATITNKKWRSKTEFSKQIRQTQSMIDQNVFYSKSSQKLCTKLI